MNKKQQEILDKANKRGLNKVGTLTGGSKYVNPKKRMAKKKTFLQKLFS